MKMPEQRKSTLISHDENEIVFSLLGFKCQTLSTTVVELFTTGVPSGFEWIYKDTGVLCLVKDSARRSYFFRLFCPARRKVLWEHEIYNDFDYLTPTEFLHTFEAENCIVGFNFACEKEADKLRVALLETLEIKKQRRERRNRSNLSTHKNVRESNGTTINANVNPIIQPTRKHTGNKDGKRRYKKEDISLPFDYRHIAHVGWSPVTGFDLDKADDPQLKEFFNQAGVSETHLKDKETREFIYDFIQRNGGMDAVKEEIKPPPIPQRRPPRPPIRIPPGPPPPPPQRLQTPRTLPATPKQEPSAEVAYPPPPPPPPPPGPPPPPMDNMPVNRSMIIQELTMNKKQLKPLNLDAEEEEKKSLPVVPDSRTQFLAEIEKGIKLRPVSTSPTQNQTSVSASGLASALAKALAERNKVIHSDSSSSSDTDDADDEWE